MESRSWDYCGLPVHSNASTSFSLRANSNVLFLDFVPQLWFWRRRSQTAGRLLNWFLTHLFQCPSSPAPSLEGPLRSFSFLKPRMNKWKRLLAAWELSQEQYCEHTFVPPPTLWGGSCDVSMGLEKKNTSICMAIWCCAHGTIEGKIDCVQSFALETVSLMQTLCHKSVCHRQLKAPSVSKPWLKVR